jgi:hypothetical protein
MAIEGYAQAIEEHYARSWGSPLRRSRLAEGPIDALPEDFCVLTLQRSMEVQVYATRCMSLIDDDDRIELHVLAPA